MKRIIYRITQQLFLFILLITIASCAHVKLISQAQESFNGAASTENAALLGSSYESLTQYTNAISSYEIAYSISSKAIKNYPKKLKKDGLLGSAYSINALSAWKLGKFEEAVSLSNIALNELSGQPRDEALMKAIPGLIKADEAFTKLGAESEITDDTYQKVKNIILDPSTGALHDFDNASANLGSGHPLLTYFQIVRVSMILTLDRADLRSGDKNS